MYIEGIILEGLPLHGMEVFSSRMKRLAKREFYLKDIMFLHVAFEDCRVCIPKWQGLTYLPGWQSVTGVFI